MPTTITAAVARARKEPFAIETLHLDDIRPKEARVRLVATGVCHTDAIVRDGLQDINKAFDDSASGATVKPVIIF